MPTDLPTKLLETMPDPQTLEDFILRGWLFYTNGENPAAEADFRHALSLDPRSEEASYGLGLSLKRQQRNDLAGHAFQRAIDFLDSRERKIDPARSSILRHLSTWQIKSIQNP